MLIAACAEKMQINANAGVCRAKHRVLFVQKNTEVRSPPPTSLPLAQKPVKHIQRVLVYHWKWKKPCSDDTVCCDHIEGVHADKEQMWFLETHRMEQAINVCSG